MVNGSDVFAPWHCSYALARRCRRIAGMAFLPLVRAGVRVVAAVGAVVVLPILVTGRNTVW